MIDHFFSMITGCIFHGECIQIMSKLIMKSTSVEKIEPVTHKIRGAKD